LHIQIASILTPLLATYAPVLASFLATGPSVLAPLHAGSLGLSI
jgi:hypothetical protein